MILLYPRYAQRKTYNTQSKMRASGIHLAQRSGRNCFSAEDLTSSAWNFATPKSLVREGLATPSSWPGLDWQHEVPFGHLTAGQ